MGNHTKNRRQTKRSPNFQVVDLGVCKQTTCPDYYPGIPHRHAFAYLYGLASPSLIRQVENLLRSCGYVGESEVEFMTPKKFSEFYRASLA